jgi:hypothetical protein
MTVLTVAPPREAGRRFRQQFRHAVSQKGEAHMTTLIIGGTGFMAGG